MKLLRLLTSLAILAGVHSQSGSGICDTPNTTKLDYAVAVGSRFPIGDAGDGPDAVQVLLALVDLSILKIDPADSSYTVRFQTDMFWERAACNTATVTLTACYERVGTWYFIVAPEHVGGSESVTASWTDVSGAGVVQDYFSNGCVSGDYLEVRSAFTHNFDMSSYPFEAHVLELKLSSFYSSEYVELLLLNQAPKETASAIPASWTLQEHWRCSEGNETTYPSGRYGRADGPSLTFDHITCTCLVTRVDWSWFLDSLLFSVLLLATNFFVQLGGVVGPEMRPKDLPDALKVRAAASVGLTFTFSLTMKRKIYGVDAGSFAGHTPASLTIFTIGIVFLTLSSFWSASVGFLALLKTRDRARLATALDVLLQRPRAIVQLTTTGHHAQVRPDMDTTVEASHEKSEAVPERVEPDGDCKVDKADGFQRWVAKMDLLVVTATHLGFFIGATGTMINAHSVWQRNIESTHESRVLS